MDLKAKFKSRRNQKRRNKQYQTIYQRCREFTMIPEHRFVINLELAEMVHDLSGSIVECGVWRGGMIAGLSSILGPQRDYYLFDSFEGLPPAKPIDGPRAVKWQQNTSSPNYYDNCKASVDFAHRIMKQSGITNYHIVPGWFEETIPSFSFTEPIALLRLDADWYDPTLLCLDHLFDQVILNGIIIIDDYFAWDGCSRAVHDFLSRRSAIERIQSIDTVCYIIKKEEMLK